MKEILMIMHTNQGLKSRQSTRPTVVTWSWPRPPSFTTYPLPNTTATFYTMIDAVLQLQLQSST